MLTEIIGADGEVEIGVLHWIIDSKLLYGDQEASAAELPLALKS